MIEAQGWDRVRGVLSSAEVASLCDFFEERALVATHRRGGAVFANRGVLAESLVAEVATWPAVISLAHRVLGDGAFAVRAIFFDKVEGANWSVPWHQDLTIAVTERAEVEGYGPWSVKEESPHVQPPARILEQMVSVRLHLDPCGPANGPLRVLPGTHFLGKLSGSALDSLVSERDAEVCVCEIGDAILMRPLVLHASSPATAPGHRRVLHIDYAAVELDAPLQWQHRVGGSTRSS